METTFTVRPAEAGEGYEIVLHSRPPADPIAGREPVVIGRVFAGEMVAWSDDSPGDGDSEEGWAFFADSLSYAVKIRLGPYVGRAFDNPALRRLCRLLVEPGPGYDWTVRSAEKFGWSVHVDCEVPSAMRTAF